VTVNRTRGRRPLLQALALTAGLSVAAWGLARTLPDLATATPGYLARDLLPVLLWALLAIACLLGLLRLIIHRNTP
jgi:hypothetical protein